MEKWSVCFSIRFSFCRDKVPFYKGFHSRGLSSSRVSRRAPYVLSFGIWARRWTLSRQASDALHRFAGFRALDHLAGSVRNDFSFGAAVQLDSCGRLTVRPSSPLGPLYVSPFRRLILAFFCCTDYPRFLIRSKVYYEEGLIVLRNSTKDGWV